MQFLFHEMAVIALAGGSARDGGKFDLPRDFRAGRIMKPRPGAIQHCPIAFFQISDAPGEGG